VRHSETTSEQPASGASSERKNARVAAVGGKNHVSCDFAYEPASISAAEKAFQSRDELVANWPRRTDGGDFRSALRWLALSRRR